MAARSTWRAPSSPELREVVDSPTWDDFVAAGPASEALPDVRPGRPGPDPVHVGHDRLPEGRAAAPPRPDQQRRAVAAGGSSSAPGEAYVNPLPLFHTAGVRPRRAGLRRPPPGTFRSSRSIRPVLDLIESRAGDGARGRADRPDRADRAPRRSTRATCHRCAPRSRVARWCRADLVRRIEDGLRRALLDRLRPDGELAGDHPGPPRRLLRGRATTIGRPLPADRGEDRRPRHRRDRCRSASWASSARAGYLSCTATTRCPTRPPTRSTPTAGCTPATSASMDDRGYCRSRAG